MMGCGSDLCGAGDRLAVGGGSARREGQPSPAQVRDDRTGRQALEEPATTVLIESRHGAGRGNV